MRNICLFAILLSMVIVFILLESTPVYPQSNSSTQVNSRTLTIIPMRFLSPQLIGYLFSADDEIWDTPGNSSANGNSSNQSSSGNRGGGSSRGSGNQRSGYSGSSSFGR